MQIEVTSHFYLNIQSAVHWVSLDLTRSNTRGEGGRAGGGTPYNGPYGEVPPEKGTLFRLQADITG